MLKIVATSSWKNINEKLNENFVSPNIIAGHPHYGTKSICLRFGNARALNDKKYNMSSSAEFGNIVPSTRRSMEI